MSRQQQSPQIINIANNQSQHPSNLKIFQKLNNFACALVQSDQKIIQNESSNLARSVATMESVIAKIFEYTSQGNNIIATISEDIFQVESLIKQHKTQSYAGKQQSLQNQIRIKHESYVKEWEQRIILAKDINMKKFAKINIEDRKSNANDLFKLILLVFYGQPLAKYYWPNFKRQAFINDGGWDLKQRLGRLKPALLRQEQKAQIKHFINNFSSVYISRQLSIVSEQIQKIRDIVKLYLKGYELSLEIKELNQKIQTEKENNLKEYDNVQKWSYRVEALNGRLDMAKQFVGALNSLQKKLQDKIGQYKNLLETAVTKKEKIEQAKISAKSSEKMDPEKLQVCECRLM